VNRRRRGRILVFARAPVPGRCKTRLIPALGARGAARLQRRLTLRTLARALRAGAEVELWCAPDPGHPFFQSCRRDFGVRLRRQPAGDLGRRMALALQRALRGGAAVLVGSDCPELTSADLRAAMKTLDTHDAVLQASPDGGYVLIGARRFERRALSAIAWSSGRELAQTRARLRRLGLRWRERPLRRDVDTPADYCRARRTGLL
jgi:hypothetical protein